MFKLHLHMFDTQVTTQDSMSVEMKTFYEKALITYADPELYQRTVMEFFEKYDVSNSEK